MDLIKYAYNFSYQVNMSKTNNNYTTTPNLNETIEDLKIEKRIKLFIKYFDILSSESKFNVINKIKIYSNENLTFDKDLQYFINQIDEKFNWNILGSFINSIKYKNFIIFIESLYRQSIFIRINNDF
jgi:hypothetical protein